MNEFKPGDLVQIKTRIPWVGLIIDINNDSIFCYVVKPLIFKDKIVGKHNTWKVRRKHIKKI